MMAIHSENRGDSPSVAQARVPDLCQHADHSRSIGLTTGLDPAMTLGCGGGGNNITSDNISPRHLLNIKRLAASTARATVSGNGQDGPGAVRHPQRNTLRSRAPRRRGQPEQRGIQLSNWRRGSTSFSPREAKAPPSGPART